MPSYVQCMTVRPSVCLSVMFVYSDRTNKRIIKKKFRHRIATRTVQVLPHQTLWQYSDGDPPPPNGGVECRWGWQKSRFSANICLHRVLSTVRTPSVIYTAAPDRGKLVTLVAGNTRQPSANNFEKKKNISHYVVSCSVQK